MAMDGRKYSPTNYRYGFNGKEKDDEVKGDNNSLDFGARIYDTRIGRFLSRDPYWKQFPSTTDYSFAGNSPIYYIDKDGEFQVSATELAALKERYPILMRYLAIQ
ncbi:MAG: hypothetical protein JST49_11595, partial [Bacteroidetes bacterium]|nr:hypothetical protein [Bacteroidota bacterium]